MMRKLLTISLFVLLTSQTRDKVRYVEVERPNIPYKKARMTWIEICPKDSSTAIFHYSDSTCQIGKINYQ